MARRRYISTEISIDPRVAELANISGPYAALLYTWLIPHADDQGCVTSDPRQIKLQVVPGLDQLGVAEISAALAAMAGLGLIELEAGVLRFPASFHKYQSYIKEHRRESAQNAANQRTSAQPVAPVSSSFSSPVPVSSSPSEPGGSGGAGGAGSVALPIATAEASPAAPPAGSDNPVSVRAAPKRPPGPGLTPIFDAFKAAGLSPPAMLKSEPTAAQDLLRHYSAEQLTACWQDYASGAYGNDVDQRNLSFGYLANHNRVGNWLSWKNGGNGSGNGAHRPRAGQNGPGPRAAAAGPGTLSNGEPDPFAKYYR